MRTCPFCEIVEGRAPAVIVREWPDALAIVPLDPVVDGHVLVLPRRHVETFFSSPDVSAATMRCAAEMLHGAERWQEPRDYNVITSAGRNATQTVMHLHVHLVPRTHGDGLELPWTAPRGEIERLGEGWLSAEEEFDRFLDDIASTAPTWDGDLTPETALAYVRGLTVPASPPHLPGARRMNENAEIERLRAGFERILERRQRQSDSHRAGVEYPSDYGRGWHDGYTTAMATCALIAHEVLDPESWAEHEDESRAASFGTDREWFERTGNCGHCGMLAEDCACTDDDPCACGPHPERRTWPRDCFWCVGTGKVEPTLRPTGSQKDE